MRLCPHTVPPPACIRTFTASAARAAGGVVRIAYRLEADLAGLRLPPPAKPARADGLWRQTCFEAFLAVPGSPAYCEFNFSPSGEWAAYRFDDYRSGMRPLDLVSPAVRWRRDARGLDLSVDLRVALAGAAANAPLRLGIAAVIEEQSGTMSHWALHHPAGPPDFHDPRGFVLELAPTGRAMGGAGTT